MSRAEAAWVSVMDLWGQDEIEVVVRVEVRRVAPWSDALTSDGLGRLQFVPVSGGSARVEGGVPALELDARRAVGVAFVQALDGASREALRVVTPPELLGELEGGA